MNKRGYLKTLEAVFAIIIFLIALFAILNTQQDKEELKPQDIELMQDTILNKIEHDGGEGGMRAEIIGFGTNGRLNPGTTYDFIESTLQNKLEFETYICIDIDIDLNPCNTNSVSMNAEKIYADSIIITDETNTGNTRIFFLYLWRTFE